MRAPTTEDGADIWALVRDTRVLDVNSPYSYLMVGEYFPETCVVAERRDRLVGFVSALLPPRRDNTVFVWQVAVARNVGRRGLGKAMLHEHLGFWAMPWMRRSRSAPSPRAAWPDHYDSKREHRT